MPNLPTRNPFTLAREQRTTSAKLKISVLDELDLNSAEEILVLSDLINSRLATGLIEQERTLHQLTEDQ